MGGKAPRPAGPPGARGVPTMNSQTKHEFWIITVSTVAMVVTCAIAFAVFVLL